MRAELNAPRPVRLSCPVRACGTPLAREERRLACPRGHSFDLARGGYANLLQPQARRSRTPGDGPEAVAARERLADAGFDRALVEAIGGWVLELGLGPGMGVLDAGCGIGTVLGRIAGATGVEAFGLDLSTPAVRAAARRHAGPLWLVDNADRRLPFLDASLDLVLSVKGPKNPPEFARVLRPGGHLLLVVPGAGDLFELRKATAGAGLPRDPAERALPRFEEALELVERRAVVAEMALDAPLLQDLLRAVYRGQRRSEAGRAAALASGKVTSDSALLLLRRRYP